jgi:hypothetical protein
MGSLEPGLNNRTNQLYRVLTIILVLMGFWTVSIIPYSTKNTIFYKLHLFPPSSERELRHLPGWI